MSDGKFTCGGVITESARPNSRGRMEFSVGRCRRRRGEEVKVARDNFGVELGCGQHDGGGNVGSCGMWREVLETVVEMVLFIGWGLEGGGEETAILREGEK